MLRQKAVWLNVAAKIGGGGISFLLYIALARMMTPEAFADVAVIFAWLAIATVLACVSAPFVLLRFIPDNLAQARAGLARGVLQFSFAATGAIATAIAAITAVAILSGAILLPRDLPQSMLYAAALMLPSVLLADLVGLLTSLKRAVVGELLVNVMRPALLIAGLGVLWFVQGPPMPAPTVLAVYLAGSVIMVLVCVAYASSILPRELTCAKPVYAIREWTRSAGGFTAVILGASLLERIDLLMMGIIGSPADVAIYAVAARFAQVILLAVSAAGTVMAPHLVERLPDLRDGRRVEVQNLVRRTARTALYVSLLALAGFATLGPFLLKLFGPHYERAYVPLVLLAIGQVLCALAGPAAAVATLAGEPRIAISAYTIGIIVNAALNFLLVPSLGANGAALATATGMTSAAVIAWARTRRHFLLDTSVFRVAQR